MGTMTTTLALCAVAAGFQPKTDVLCDKVDLIEVNHFYDEKGQLVLDQLIFYDWSPAKGHYDVRDWCLLKSPVQVPRKDHATQRFVTVYRDGRVLRKVYAKTVRESWTQHDPELLEQEFLPREKRRLLTKASPPRRRHRTAAQTRLTQATSQDPSRR